MANPHTPPRHYTEFWGGDFVSDAHTLGANVVVFLGLRSKPHFYAIFRPLRGLKIAQKEFFLGGASLYLLSFPFCATIGNTMNQSSPYVGCVIVSYNTCGLLRACLESLRDSSLPLYSLVVDNCSSDASVAMVQATFPDVRVHALVQNRGFAAGINVGLRLLGFGGESSGDVLRPAYVLLLNPDTVVEPDAIRVLVDFLETHPRVGVASPRLLNPDGSMQPAAFRFPTLMMSVLDVFPPGEVLPGRLYGSWWHGRYPEEQVGEAPFPVDHPLGACLLVRASVIDDVGLLDEHYFMYSEEIDWCWRIRQAGWAIWQVPDARVVHVGGASTQQVRYPMLIALHRSRVQFFQKHYPSWFLRFHRLVTRGGMLRAILCAWGEYVTHRIGRDDLRQRLWAFGEICRL